MNGVLHSAARFIVYANIWVALCLSALVLGVAKHYGITDCWLFALFSFLGTFATYNFHRLVRNIQFEKLRLVTERICWQNRFRPALLSLSLACAVAAAVIFFYLPVKPLSLLLLGIAGIIVFFYAIPVPGRVPMLRSVPFLKNFLILLVWIVLICVPLINRGKTIDPAEITAIALFTFAQIIPFDVRDLPYDSSSMKTIPQLLGKTTARVLATGLVFLSALLLGFVSGFHWLLAVPVGLSIYGCWAEVTERNATVLELVWDGSLLLLGVYFYVMC